MKCSVCMAVYNGEEYLKKQLVSILEQLNIEDEIIIVNDASTDNSLCVINSFCDQRIKVINNINNLGVIRSFEKALNQTSGDIIFLADQDDIWTPGKVDETIEYMMKFQCNAVVSDALVIDDQGEIICDSYFTLRQSGPGIWKNFYRNSYIGCCMAIRSDVKPFILPFPKSIPMHDAWIGMVCDFLGEVKFVPKQLVAYRRHLANQSELQGKDWNKMINKRFIWLKLMSIELPKLWLKINFQYNYLYFK
jgi:glycosyltransferase involved in cell wall biosynthesis